MDTLSFGLTFDDVLLLPGFTDFTRAEITLSTNLSKNISLKIPFVSSPMDTVTESRLAISLAKLGGIGIIHRNLTISKQAEEVSRVKKMKLLVGAAVGSSKGVKDRIKTVVISGADILVIDSAHGFTKDILSTLKFVKRNYPNIDVMVGNISTKDAARVLIKAGADALRVGMGSGAICTTRVVSGIGVPQITAISDVSSVAKKNSIPVVADGGIKYSGDIVKALASGASTVMMGSFFAQSKESPGRTKVLRKNQVPHRFQSIFNHSKKTFTFKEYRGMGSDAAMKKGEKIKVEDEFHGKSYYKERTLVAEGVEGLVPVRGTVEKMLHQALGGIKSGMFYTGAKSIADLWKKAKFVRITQASLNESHPHGIIIENPGKSYL